MLRSLVGSEMCIRDSNKAAKEKKRVRAMDKSSAKSPQYPVTPRDYQRPPQDVQAETTKLAADLGKATAERDRLAERVAYLESQLKPVAPSSAQQPQKKEVRYGGNFYNSSQGYGSPNASSSWVAYGSQGAPKQPNCCWHCGQPGHYARACPYNQAPQYGAPSCLLYTSPSPRDS